MQNNALWDNLYLTSLNASTAIVRNRHTGQLMLRRVGSAESFPVMHTLSTMRHPNLMEVYDVRFLNGKCVSLCEYINGMTLEKRVELRGLCQVTEATAILRQICDGLTALHLNGVIHRDVKPSNVMLTPDNRVKLIDYDISRLSKPMQSRDTTLMGTEGYAPPEQFGFGQTGAQADVYACGALLNYLLTGFLPNERLYQGALTSVILQCTEIDANKRFRSAEELKQVLLGRKINTRRGFRPLPGFRGRHVFPKILTVILMTLWSLLLLMYVTGGRALYTDDPDYMRRQLCFGSVLLLFWSAIPYLLFGDIFRISEKISPNNPRNGLYVLRILGAASFVVGLVLLITVC